MIFLDLWFNAIFLFFIFVLYCIGVALMLKQLNYKTLVIRMSSSLKDFFTLSLVFLILFSVPLSSIHFRVSFCQNYIYIFFSFYLHIFFPLSRVYFFFFFFSIFFFWSLYLSILRFSFTISNAIQFFKISSLVIFHKFFHIFFLPQIIFLSLFCLRFFEPLSFFQTQRFSCRILRFFFGHCFVIEA